jgi:hypothetical protein
MFGRNRTGGSGEFVFPDWSPYTDLAEAAGSYLRDAEIAMEDLTPLLTGRPVLGFILERLVMDDGRVWQEAAVCDGTRLVLWHGEDVPDGAPGVMTSAVRTIPLKSISEVGCRRHLQRDEHGQTSVTELEVYVLLRTVDEVEQMAGEDEQTTVYRHDAVRFGKTLQDGGEGQIGRLLNFAQLLSSVVAAKSELDPHLQA